jgi:hypothetical protein
MSFLLKGLTDRWKGSQGDGDKKDESFFPTVDTLSPREKPSVPSVTIPAPKTPIAGGSLPSTPSPSTLNISPLHTSSSSPLVSPRITENSSVSPRRNNSSARQASTRLSLLKQAQQTNDKNFSFDDKNKFVSFKEETYIPMSYAKDKLQQVLADWTQMKQEYITAIEDIDAHYKQQDAEQLNKMKEFVKEYQNKYKTLREKHNLMKEEKNKEISEKVNRLSEELKVRMLQRSNLYDKLEREAIKSRVSYREERHVKETC